MIMIKKIIIGITTFLVSASVLADTVNVTTKVVFSKPMHSTSSTASYAFTPSDVIVFEVAGKTCTWNSSAKPQYGAGAGQGCNYSITVDSNGELINPNSNSNGCTNPKAMLKQCN